MVGGLGRDEHRATHVCSAELGGNLAPSLLVRPELGPWAVQWDRLVDLSPLRSPFLRSWWLTGTSGHRRHFVLVVQDEVLLGGLALEEKRRLGIRSFIMMGAGPLCPDHLDLLAARGQEAVVVTRISTWLRRSAPRLLDLEGIDADSLLINVLPVPVHRERLAVAPWAALPADPDAYLAARPALFRRNVRRASSRLAAEGASHRVKRGSPAIRSLDTLRRLHHAQWGNRSRFLPSFGRFSAACALAAEADEIAVHELAIGESVIAIVVVFEVAGRISLYQSARMTDSRWRDAMMVLLNATIQDACIRGFTEVDFLRGDEAYKNNFAPQQRQLLRLKVINGKFARELLMAETVARKVKRLATPGEHRHPDGGPGNSGPRLFSDWFGGFVFGLWGVLVLGGVVGLGGVGGLVGGDPGVDELPPVIEPFDLGFVGGVAGDLVVRDAPPAGFDDLVDGEPAPDVGGGDDGVQPGVGDEDDVGAGAGGDGGEGPAGAWGEQVGHVPGAGGQVGVSLGFQPADAVPPAAGGPVAAFGEDDQRGLCVQVLGEVLDLVGEDILPGLAGLDEHVGGTAG